MARTKPAVLLLAAALLVWVSKLSCDFVAPARTRSSRADTHSLERVTSASSAFQSRFDSFFGSTACLVVLGIASTSTSRKGCRIVGLRAEAKEAAAEEEGTEAAKEGAAPQAESEDGSQDEEMADDNGEDGEEGEEVAETHMEKSSKWRCLDCSAMNFAAATACEKCGAAKPSAEEAALVEERDQAKEEVAKVMDGFLRMQADLQNYRRQHDEAMGRARDLGKLDALRKLLPLNEEIAAALVEPEGLGEKEKATHDSYSLLFRKVSDVWAKGGVQSLTAAPGDKFDEVNHVAVEEREPTDGQDAGTILEVVKSGYQCDGKVVLPTEVVVVAAAKKEEEPAKEEKEEGAAEETEETPEAADA